MYADAVFNLITAVRFTDNEPIVRMGDIARPMKVTFSFSHLIKFMRGSELMRR